jgi:hypothetical protein
MKSIQIFKNSGFAGLSKRTAGYLYRRTIRQFLPTLSEVKYAGIPISRERKLGDLQVPDFLIPHPLEDIQDYEQTLIAALGSQVRVGDKVIIVGGGEGVTAVVAAKAVGERGSVVCFEGSKWGVGKIKATAARNKVSKRLSVKHAIVGEAISVYGVPEDHSTLVVAPADLPDCDILELDCEGAEIIILRNMRIRPRAIAVESHGVFGAPSKLVREILEKLGYSVEDCGVAEPRDPEGCEARDIRVLLATRR